MSKPSKRAGAPEVPHDVLRISYRVLMGGAGWEQPGLDDHSEAVQELLLALIGRGWTIWPPEPISPEIVQYGRKAWDDWLERHPHLDDECHYVSDHLKDELIVRILAACSPASSQDHS